MWNLYGTEASTQPPVESSTDLSALESSRTTADLSGMPINNSETPILNTNDNSNVISFTVLSTVTTTFSNVTFTSANLSIQSSENIPYSSDGSISKTLSDLETSESSDMVHVSIASSTRQTTPSAILSLTSDTVSDEGSMTTSLTAHSVKDSLRTVSLHTLPVTDEFTTGTNLLKSLSSITTETVYSTVTNETVDSSYSTFFSASDVLGPSLSTDVLTSSSSLLPEYDYKNAVPTFSFTGEITVIESFQPDPNLSNASTTFALLASLSFEVSHLSSERRLEESRKLTLTNTESSSFVTESSSPVFVSSTSEISSSSTIVPSIPLHEFITSLRTPSTASSSYLHPSFTSVIDEAEQSDALSSTPVSTTSLHSYVNISNSDLLSTIESSGIEFLYSSSSVSIDSLTRTNINTLTSDRQLLTENLSVDMLQKETSSLELPTSASITHTLHSSDIVLPPYVVTSERPKTYRIILTFEGSCGRMEYNEQLKIEFLKSLIDVIDDYLPELSEDDFELDQIECHPFKVVLLLKNVRDEDSLNNLISSVRNNAVEVPIIDRIIVNYHAIGIQLMPVSNETTDNMETRTRTGLEISDIVVIAISALLFAFLIFLCGIVICRECYKRKRAASFNLIDVPHVNLKLDDFTLTKIPRPKMTYFDNKANPIVTNGKHRQGRTKDTSINGDGKRVSVNSENIHVRMRDHSDGIVIGVTCSPALNDAHSAKSTSSSQSSPGLDRSEQVLLKDNSSERGATNPNCNVDDEEDIGKECYIKEDDNEEIL